LLAGLRDPALGRALHAMHADIRAHWTVAQLSKIAGMSRSAFSARFGSVVGHAPMEYLTGWRMAVPRLRLPVAANRWTGSPMISVMNQPALQHRLRKRLGSPPGSFARRMVEA
jgi:methylphosphotriester-DNA--protein-cysteine methyltransferase